MESSAATSGGGTVHASKLRVFLCHASPDKARVLALYHQLVADGFEPWLAEEDLVPGQHWEQEIGKAVRSAGVVLVCLSQQSLTRQGFVQKEIRIALSVAEEQPEGAIYIIPVRLEECDMPDSLRQLHRVDLFNEVGYQRLLLALQSRAAALGVTTPPRVSDASRNNSPRDRDNRVVPSDTEIWNAIDTYAAAITYRDARQLGGVLIRPLAKQFSGEHVVALINVVIANTQLWQCVYGVNATPRVLQTVFETTRHHLPHTRRAWRALLAFIDRCSITGSDDYRDEYATIKSLVEATESYEG